MIDSEIGSIEIDGSAGAQIDLIPRFLDVGIDVEEVAGGRWVVRVESGAESTGSSPRRP